MPDFLQTLSTDPPQDHHHHHRRERGKAAPLVDFISHTSSVIPSALTSASASQEHGTSASKPHRLSLAALAREKTNNALATLSLRSKPSHQSLHSSSSSAGSPTKLTPTHSTSPSASKPAATKPLPIDPIQNIPLAEVPAHQNQRPHQAPPIAPATGATVWPASTDRAPSPSEEPASAPTTSNLQGALNKMHQTSSRLLRMTDEERPFTRDFEDLFSTLMVSLPLSSHRVRFQKVDHTFTSEEAINNLGSLKFSQSNRMPDPKDPSRIVTTTTTTTFSMAKEMARSVCQRFMDARFVESSDGKFMTSFPLKNAVWHLTPKGMHVLTRFCQRNGINQRHVLDVLDSPRNAMQLVILERDAGSDKLSHDRATIEVIFRRFAGQEPNLKNTTSASDSDSLSDYYNGMVGVKMARERKILEHLVANTFTGKAAVDWLMDCCTTVDRREVYEIAELFVQHGLMRAVVEDKVFIHQQPGTLRFQPTKNAIYGLTDKGERIAGWRHDDSSDDGPTSSANNFVRRDRTGPRDSNNNRLNSIVNDPALRLLFREFLRDTHCEENLAFFLEVREFTRSYDGAERANAFKKLDAIRESLAAAYGLYNAFLAPGSPCELNIDHNLRNSLAGRMTRAVGDDDSMLQGLQEVVDLFREAQVSVFKLMSSDSVPKFLKEPKYTTVLAQNNFDHGGTHQSAIPERTRSRVVRERA